MGNRLKGKPLEEQAKPKQLLILPSLVVAGALVLAVAGVISAKSRQALEDVAPASTFAPTTAMVKPMEEAEPVHIPTPPPAAAVPPPFIQPPPRSQRGGSSLSAFKRHDTLRWTSAQRQLSANWQDAQKNSIGSVLQQATYQPVAHVQPEPVTSAGGWYDANDRLQGGGRIYDSNGNLLNDGKGHVYRYDFQDKLSEVNNGQIKYVRDGDGNIVQKIEGGKTTRYLVDSQNPTGLPQVVEELVNGNLAKVYTYGHSLISVDQIVDNNWTASFYGYDGHGNVRLLANEDGQVTDTYTFDAFGILIHASGNTPNDRLFCGEAYDDGSGLYNLRNRQMDVRSGRFTSLDTHPGSQKIPMSLHKFLYCQADPVNYIDPTGTTSLAQVSAAVGIGSLLAVSISTPSWGTARAEGRAARLGGIEGVQAEIYSNTSTITQLNNLIDGIKNSDRPDSLELDPSFDAAWLEFQAVGKMGVILRPVAGEGDTPELAQARQHVRNSFEVFNNFHGWKTGGWEGLAKVANNGQFLDLGSPQLTGNQRMAIAEALLARQQQYQVFLENARAGLPSQ